MKPKIILELEKQLNTKFQKADVSKTPSIRTGKTAEYLTDNNGDITGLMFIHSDIEDFSFLKDLKSLTSLDLSSNNITDISFLKDLRVLTRANA